MLAGKLAAIFAQMVIGSDWINNPGIGMFLGSSAYPVPPQAACPLRMLLGSLLYHTCCWAACPVANHIQNLICLLLFYLILFISGISIYIYILLLWLFCFVWQLCPANRTADHAVGSLLCWPSCRATYPTEQVVGQLAAAKDSENHQPTHMQNCFLYKYLPCMCYLSARS